MGAMPVLTAQDLRKAYGPQVLLDGVSLTIGSGESVGLVGINGSGKSTLAKILAGEEPVDSGTIARRRDTTVAYLAQDPALDGTKTALDITLAGLGEWSRAREAHRIATHGLETGVGDPSKLVNEQEAAAAELERQGGWNLLYKAEAILANLGVDRTDVPVATFSGGEKRRVALATILVSNPSLAILDEPTNHLDVGAIEWLENYLIDDHKGALLLITHDRYVLNRIAERTIELENARVHSYDGGYDAYLEGKAERLALDARTETKRQNFLRRELDWLRRSPPARTRKPKARTASSEAILAQRPVALEKRARLQMDSARFGKTILDVRDVSIAIGDRKLADKITFALSSGDRIGIIGRNGSGKTTLLRAILGDLEPSAGTITRGLNTKIAYFDQNRIALDDNMSIYDNVAESRSEVEIGGRSLDVRSYLEGFLFDVPKQRQKVASLSGGERARVALAKMMRTGANLVIFDEPTNDLDISTLGALEEMLVEHQGCAIIVSHDRWFLDRVATAILAFEPDGRVEYQPGDYQTYLRLKNERAAETRRLAAEQRQQNRASSPPRAKAPDARASEPPQPAASKPAPSATSKPAGKPLTYAERLELDGILEKIEAGDARVRDLEAKLSDPSLYGSGSHTDIADLNRKLEEARAASAALALRWESLEERRDVAKPNG